MNPGGFTVSVVICAYTQLRWDELNAAVVSVLAQTVPSEVIVVIDHEEVLFKRAQDAWPTVTVVENALKQGLSGARNTGIELASGEIIAFLDDDASAIGDDWLALLLAPYADERVLAVGGSALPLWPNGAAPATLPPELLWVVGCTYEGQPTTLADVRNLMGCNMSFKRDVLRDIGSFNIDMGRVGTLPLGCEETEACIRISERHAGSRIVFEPRASVRHTVTPNRLTWSYVLRRGYGEGLSKAALSRMLGMTSSLSTEASYASSVLPRGVARELGRGGRPASALAIILVFAATGFGYVRGSVSAAVRRQPKIETRPELETSAS